MLDDIVKEAENFGKVDYKEGEEVLTFASFLATQRIIAKYTYMANDKSGAENTAERRAILKTRDIEGWKESIMT